MLQFPNFKIYNKKTNNIENITQINFETKSIITDKCNCFLFDNEDIQLIKEK